VLPRNILDTEYHSWTLFRKATLAYSGPWRNSDTGEVINSVLTLIGGLDKVLPGL